MSVPGRVRSHGRNNSSDERRRIAITRRASKGPLDPLGATVDDPLAIRTSSPARSPGPSIRPSMSPRPPSSIHSPSPSLTSKPSHHPLDEPTKDLSHLLAPAIFNPLPITAIPQPFQSSPHQPSSSTPLPTLLQAGHYRPAAIVAANLLANSTSATDAPTIFQLFYTRLSCLTVLGLHGLAAAEAKALGDLSSSFYRNPISGAHIVPWELRVLAVRLQGLGYGDWRRGVMGYYELAREARIAMVHAAPGSEERAMWKVRLRDVGIRVAAALVEMDDGEGAARHLASMRRGRSHADADGGLEDARLRSVEALVWLRVGDVDAARDCLHPLAHPSTSETETNPSSEGKAETAPSADDDQTQTQTQNTTIPPAALEALIHMADADLPAALAIWSSLHASAPHDAMIAQNRAVCLLYTGRIAEAREALEKLVDRGDALQAVTFNLATVYELCTERARERKDALVERVAALEPGSGCGGWERMGADFKL